MESQERKMRRGRHGQTAASLCPSTQTPKAGKFPNIGRGSRCQVAACHLPQSILLVAQHRPASLVLYLHSQKGRARPAQTNAPGWYDLMLSPLPQGACDRLISYCVRVSESTVSGWCLFLLQVRRGPISASVTYSLSCQQQHVVHKSEKEKVSLSTP